MAPPGVETNWVIKNWRQQKGKIKPESTIRLAGIEISLSTRCYPDCPSHPFGVTVKVKRNLPEAGFTLKVSFLLTQTKKQVERDLRLFPQCNSDTVYFPGLLEREIDLYCNSNDCLSLRCQFTALANLPSPIEKAPAPQPPRFVGLANQGATCYMNSILQTLFHLTEFRRVVYSMPTDDVMSDGRADSIALNLQSLFFSMQQGAGASCTTLDLTTSFGWSGDEAFVQHDIQEFVRVLLVNIEEKLAKIDRRDAIAAIFRGQFQHSITNTEKQFCQKRLEDFYDISLQVKGCASVVDSLRKFTSAERLTGDNTYDAGELGKIPVTIEIKIMKLPPVLQLHLKRFEYDLTRFSLVKIDTEFHFAQVLDMRPFLARESTETDTKYQLFGVLVHSGTAFGATITSLFVLNARRPGTSSTTHSSARQRQRSRSTGTLAERS
jgi:ubiquitin C-terminal hydrolase